MLRVGVVATEVTERSGGSFTFQREIVEQLSLESSSEQIQWIIITPGGISSDKSQLNAGIAQYETISFRARDHKLGLFLKWIYSHARSFFYRTPFKETMQRRSEFFGSKLAKLQLDLIWYLSPHAYTQEIPYALTVWDLQHRLQPWFPEVSSDGQWVQRERQNKRYIRRASIIFTGNETGAREICTTYGIPPERVLVNPLPVPSDALQYGSHKIASNAIVFLRHEFGCFILYPAQFWAHKNHTVLLQAMAILKPNLSAPLNLVLTGGDKGNMDYIMRLAGELQLSEQLVNLEFIDRKDLLFLYSEARALVFPSLFGPDNIPPLEAMAVGCPVIAADVPGMRQQLGSAALYCSPTDPVEWATAISSIINDGALRNTLIHDGEASVRQSTVAHYVKNVENYLLEFKKIRETWG